jgi:hypothetical protein
MSLALTYEGYVRVLTDGGRDCTLRVLGAPDEEGGTYLGYGSNVDGWKACSRRYRSAEVMYPNNLDMTFLSLAYYEGLVSVAIDGGLIWEAPETIAGRLRSR